jgi:hypothetical protein
MKVKYSKVIDVYPKDFVLTTKTKLLCDKCTKVPSCKHCSRCRGVGANLKGRCGECDNQGTCSTRSEFTPKINYSALSETQASLTPAQRAIKTERKAKRMQFGKKAQWSKEANSLSDEEIKEMTVDKLVILPYYTKFYALDKITDKKLIKEIIAKVGPTSYLGKKACKRLAAIK